MSQQLINHSQDLKRLRDEGYEIEVRGGYLLVHHVPYVNQQKMVKFGVLVSTLSLVNNLQTATPETHVIYFSGEPPCNTDGTLISAIQHSNVMQQFGNEITVNHSFSNKPSNGYPSYYEKVKRYADILSAPAKAIDESVTEKTFRPVSDNNGGSVFKYIDTNSSRANINAINRKLEGERIAIIGIGGTGAYILDLVSKTPVAEIHVYDGDKFHQHNAFRSPGAATFSALEKDLMKADYFSAVYGEMRNGIFAHPYYVRTENLSELRSYSFVFISIDSSTARKQIVDYLVHHQIKFIDVGLGVNVVDEQLIGAVRVTAATPEKIDHLSDRLPGDADDHNVYATNIQIADLNSLNASFAVIKWKKMIGFYQDLEKEHHSSYDINVNKIFNEDDAA